MNFNKYRIDEITINLDNLRKPLNNEERKKISHKKLYPYYGANNIMDYVDEYIFEEEILCIAEDGGSWGFGEKCSYIVDEKCWVNNHAHVLKAKSDYLNLKYLNYYLNYHDLNSKITGTTRGKLTKSALNSIEVALPNREKQDILVDILDKCKYLIDKRKIQAKELDELVKSRFIEMFGDPVSNPKGWNREKLNNLGELARGKSKHRPRNAPELLNGPYPLVQTGDIANAGIYLKEYTQTYSELGLKQSKMWHKGTLCITIAANIAKTSILTFDACFPDSVVAFIPNEKTNNMFIQFWMSFLQKILEDSAPESAQKNINLKILSEQNVIVPPIELQNKFADFVEQVDKLKFEMEKSLKELEDNFNSLMQKAFKGELF